MRLLVYVVGGPQRFGGDSVNYQIFVGGLPINKHIDLIDQVFDFKFSLGIESVQSNMHLVPVDVCSGVATRHVKHHCCLPTLPNRLIHEPSTSVHHKSNESLR